MNSKTPIHESLFDFATSLCQQYDFDETLRLITQQAFKLFVPERQAVLNDLQRAKMRANE